MCDESVKLWQLLFSLVKCHSTAHSSRNCSSRLNRSEQRTMKHNGPHCTDALWDHNGCSLN